METQKPVVITIEDQSGQQHSFDVLLDSGIHIVSQRLENDILDAITNREHLDTLKSALSKQ